MPERALPKPFIKICGLTRARDSAFASRAGASMLGFIFHPQSPRYLSPVEAKRLPTGGSLRVGVCVGQKAKEIAFLMDKARLDLAQFHGEQDLEDARAIGPEKVIRALWPQRWESLAQMDDERKRWEENCAYFLLDSGLRGGGHGQRLDSPLIEAFAARSARPVILAGGLSPSHLASLWPWGLDAKISGFDFNSGVETAPGLKDREALALALAWGQARQNESRA
ncbi:MAG: phosphoribosylanthranilate isomerase [Deltaproteobacteria bacterium]|nr:phosphoribosylanthranilate isomerase [Deltaproteobacteria bacterium]